MSRNARQKFPRVPAKPPKRRGSDTSSSLDLSDDEGYSAVEEISESEDDDEEHVFAAEEEHIISHEAHRGHARPLRPQKDDEDDADEEDDSDDEEAEEPEVTEVVGQVQEDVENGEEVASWDGILSDGDEDTVSDFTTTYSLDPNVANVERHVRFTGVPDSDSDSTTTDTSEDVEGFFPDIFVEQASLDPAFRREIEYDPDESSASGGSFWDFQSSQDHFDVESEDEFTAAPDLDDDTPTATPMMSQAPSEVSTPVASGVVQELDGYETDGDTTEEDIPEPLIRRKQVRRVQTVDASSDSDAERPAHYNRGQPRLGRYNLDSSDRKPVAVVNPISRKMMIFTPQRIRRLDLSPESFNLDFFTNPPVTESPILSNSASLMMSAMFSSNTFGDFINTQAVGPAEAFFSLASDGVTAEESDETGADDEEDEEERNLKLDDFITFHSEDSDDEGQDENNWDGDTNTAASTPARPRTSASTVSTMSDGNTADVHPLLNHFDNHSNAVGAFRRNQINQQLILSDRATQESLAFSGPYHYGTLRGIKTGSLETVTAPITPLRRHKRNSANGYGDYNKSPLESMSQKRKASTALSDSFHKRHRSISDMEVLHL